MKIRALIVAVVLLSFILSSTLAFPQSRGSSRSGSGWSSGARYSGSGSGRPSSGYSGGRTYGSGSGHYSGGHSGSRYYGSGSGYYYGGGHGGSHAHYSHGYYGWGFGLSIYPGWWGYPYYPYSYPYPYYYRYPYSYPYPYYYDYAPPPAARQEAPSYSGPEQEQPLYWYYCQDSQSYYPYVKSCPGGWMKVVPNAPPPDAPGRRN